MIASCDASPNLISTVRLVWIKGHETEESFCHTNRKSDRCHEAVVFCHVCVARLALGSLASTYSSLFLQSRVQTSFSMTQGEVVVDHDLSQANTSNRMNITGLDIAKTLEE
jgi:inosine-uridine nucleoside N-ribohydrolase